MVGMEENLNISLSLGTEWVMLPRGWGSKWVRLPSVCGSKCVLVPSQSGFQVSVRRISGSLSNPLFTKYSNPLV